MGLSYLFNSHPELATGTSSIQAEHPMCFLPENIPVGMITTLRGTFVLFSVIASVLDTYCLHLSYIFSWKFNLYLSFAHITVFSRSMKEITS